MADYQKMYYTLCDAASKALDAPLGEAARILQNALHEAEEIYQDTCGDAEGEQ